jgi:hypothetical protein
MGIQNSIVFSGSHTAKGRRMIKYWSMISIYCCIQLDQQGKRNHRFFLKQFTQAASLFKSPASRGTSVFIHSSHNHASTNHHRSHHLTRKACSANQGLRASHPPNMGLFTAWHRFPSGLARESGMVSYTPMHKPQQSSKPLCDMTHEFPNILRIIATGKTFL